jgi:hypothetical protein
MGHRFRLLLSYWYFKTLNLDEMIERYFAGTDLDLFIDSGGFSAMTQGAKIDRAEYATWLKRWQHRITVYANLDVIRNPEATWDNQRYLEDQGLNPLPVFHGGSPYTWLEHYLDRYPYIALGGLVGQPVPAVRQHIAYCFKLAGNRAVYHGFGVSQWPLLRAFRWYSVDSSSWGAGYRYGDLALFDPRRGTWHDLKIGDPKSVRPHLQLIRSYGIDPTLLMSRSACHHHVAAGLSAIAYYLSERWLAQRHGPVTIPARIGRLAASVNPERDIPDDSTRVYLGGDKNKGRLSLANEGIKSYLADGSITNLGAGNAGIKSYLASANLTYLSVANRASQAHANKQSMTPAAPVPAEENARVHA